VLWLVGMMGSGKSTVGMRVARTGGHPFVDTDAVVEERARASIPEIFTQQGESAFRSLEEAVIADVAARSVAAVVATGGGAVLSEANIGLMRQGTVVWLSASPATLARRLEGSSGRPLLTTEGPTLDALDRLLAERRPAYERAAHVVIEVDRLDPDEAATEVMAAWAPI
jgi:shikimate kinase